MAASEEEGERRGQQVADDGPVRSPPAVERFEVALDTFARLAPSGALTLEAGREALGANGVEDPLAVLGTVGLQDELNAASRMCRSMPSRRCSTSRRLAPARQRYEGGPRARPAGRAGPSRAPAAAPPPSRQCGCIPRAGKRRRSRRRGRRRSRRGGAGRPSPHQRATPTAPAPSTTSFARSRRSTIASAASSSFTRRLVEERSISGAVSSPRPLDGDPVADRLRPVFFSGRPADSTSRHHATSG